MIQRLRLVLPILFLLGSSLPVLAQLPPNQPEQDCINALPVCQNTFIQPNSYQGAGVNSTEIDGGPSCLGGGEVNDVWYIFTVQTAGNLCFSITPANTNDDYDWAVFNLTSASCADIFGDPTLEVSCNFSGASGITGPNGQAGGQNEPCLAVNPGETYVVNVSNWSGTGSGYTLDFGASTANIFDNIPPVFDDLIVDCGSSDITVAFSENVLCNTVSPSDFTVTGPAGTYTVTGITGLNCVGGGTFEDEFSLQLVPAPVPGTYTVTLVSDVEDNCGNIANSGTQSVFVGNIGITASALPATICQGTSTTLTTNVANDPAYTFTWQPGNLTTPSPVVNPNATTTYTVNAVDAAGCVSNSSVTVTVVPSPTGNFTVSPTLVCGNQTATITYTGTAGPTAIFVWDFGAGATATNVGGTPEGPYQVSWGNSGQKDVSLLVTELGCTSQPVMVTVDVGVDPTATFVAPSSACIGDTVLVTYTGNAPAGATYFWDFDGPAFSTSTGATPQGPYKVVWNTSGPKTICLQVDDNGCVSTIQCFPVNVTPTPSSSFNANPAQVCGTQASTLTYTGNAPAGSVYIWDFDGGTPSGPGTGPGPHNVSWPSTGQKNVSLQVFSNGCPSLITTIPIDVILAPTATFSAPTSVCIGDTAFITYTGNAPASAGFSWNFNSPSFQGSANVQGPYKVVWNTPGTKNVCLQVNNSGCLSPLSCVQITVNPKPIAGIAPVIDQCLTGNNFSFTSTGTTSATSYSWNFGSGANPGLSSLQTPPPVSYVDEGTKTVSLVVTENGCVSDSAKISFEVIPMPSANFSANTGAACSDTCVTLTYTGGVIGNGLQSYSWNFGGNSTPLTSSLQNPGCIDFTMGGTQTVTLVVDYRGCTDASVQLIDVNNIPQAIAGPDLAFCEGDGGVQVDAQVSGMDPGVNYDFFWTCDSPPCGISNSFAEDPVLNPTVINAPADITYYFYAETDDGCRSNLDSLIVTVKAKPKVDAGPDLFICPDGPGEFLTGGPATNNAAPLPFIYNWTPGAGINPTDVANPYARPDTTTIYTLVATSINGCTSDVNTLDTTSTTTVQVVEYPVANAGADTAVCLGDTIQLQGFASGSSGPYSFAWSPTPNYISNASSPTPLVSPPATTVFYLIASAKGCDSKADSIVVQVDSKPTIDPGSDRITCLGDSIQLDGSAAGDPNASQYNYTWTPAIGLSDPNTGKPLASPDTTTTYEVIAFSNFGCGSDIATVLVTVEPTPIVSALSADTIICEGSAIQLSATHEFTTTPAGGPVTYFWTPNSSVAGSPALSTVTVAPTSTTLYTVSASVSGDCPTTDQVLVSVSPAITAGIAADTTTICSGESTQLAASGGLGSADYLWIPAAGLDNPTSQNPLATPDTTTTYELVLSEGACTDTTEVTIEVNPSPVAEYVASQATGCEGLEVSFLQTATDANSFQWDFGDGSEINNEENPTYAYMTSGSYVVSLTVVGDGGCENTVATTTVTVSDNAFANFSSDPDINVTQSLPEAVVRFTDLSNKAVSWFWDFGDGSFSDEASPTHVYDDPGDYTVSLTVTDENGCIGTLDLGPYVVYAPGLLIPNVFTPNSDGINDEFQILYDGKESFFVEVFDRWGGKYFSTPSPDEGWDGSMGSGGQAKEGVYFYQLKIGDKAYTGNITLMR